MILCENICFAIGKLIENEDKKPHYKKFWKSFIVGIVAFAIANLYPYSEIVITSSTEAQANRLASKMFDEIMKKNSPILLYMYEHDYWWKYQRDGNWVFENKLNGSTIMTVAPIDSSRGPRSTVLIFEEARLIKANVINSIFRPMAHPRQAKFLSREEYENNDRWLEETKFYYLSSASYKHEWLYNSWKKTFVNIFKASKVKYNVFAADIFTAMANGLKTKGDYNKALKMSSETEFLMEDCNCFIGEAEDAFFSYKLFMDVQVNTEPFRPFTAMQIVMGEESNFIEKKENEVRLVVADFAFTETKKGSESDYTQFICMSGVWKKDKFVRRVDYLETWPANDDEGAVIRLKELFYDYKADYIIPDVRNGGESIFVLFSKPLENESRGSLWNKQGFGVADAPRYHIATPEKLNFYRQRAIDRDYLPCLIPFVGTANTNTAYWRSLKRTLEKKNISLLISMQDKQTELEDNGRYFELEPEQLAEELAPFGQTDMLIQEAVNLQTTIKNDQIKLDAPSNGHRDRIVTLAMGNYIMDKIEESWRQQEQNNNYDIAEIDLVF